MRKITKIILHCSDSDHAHHDNIKTIREWHIERGFSEVGYHYFIRKSGDLEIGRELEIVGAHARGHNHHSVGICLSGRHKFAEIQFQMLAAIVMRLMDKFNLRPSDIYLHNELDNGKTCPNFKKVEILSRVVGPFNLPV
jgi:N-acetyl-anhydromuramyl-L-alanine amidase AmpD